MRAGTSVGVRDLRRNVEEMKVVIAGNHDADPGVVAMDLLTHLAELPIDVIVLLRGPLHGHPGAIEQLAEGLCRDLSIEVDWRLPRPGEGKEATIYRDFDMVDDADLVIAYFHPERQMEGGTGRVVERALSSETTVIAFIAEEDGPLRLGESEGAVVASGRGDRNLPAPGRGG